MIDFKRSIFFAIIILEKSVVMIFYILVMLIINYEIFIKSNKGLHILQESSYNLNNTYFKWFKKNTKGSFLHLDIVSLMMAVLALLLHNKWSIGLIIIATILVICDTEIIKYSRMIEPMHEKLRYTKRMVLVIFLVMVIEVLPLVYYLINPSTHFVMLLIEFVILTFINVIIPLVNYLIIPLVELDFIINANLISLKLKRLKNLKIIGITGSNGKSNVLNILNEILNKDIVTSKINNKQYGLLYKSIKLLNKNTKYFAIELGATSLGEINKVCRVIKPNYGLMTNIGLNHLDTFKTQENILKSNFEIVDQLNNGLMILNADDELEFSKAYNHNIKTIWYGINNNKADVIAKNIKMDEKGTTFNVYVKSIKETYEFKTKIIGLYNIYNLLAVIALLFDLGIEIKDIQKGIAQLDQFKGYFNIINNKESIYINDQSNANPDGVKAALDVLKIYKGIKIVVTPGMVDLGKEEYFYNKEFGQYIAKVCDYVILVGDKQTKSIQDGLKLVNYDMHKVMITNDINEVKEIIENIKTDEKKIILWENKLSDIYSE